MQASLPEHYEQITAYLNKREDRLLNKNCKWVTWTEQFALLSADQGQCCRESPTGMNALHPPTSPQAGATIIPLHRWRNDTHSVRSLPKVTQAGGQWHVGGVPQLLHPPGQPRKLLKGHCRTAGPLRSGLSDSPHFLGSERMLALSPPALGSTPQRTSRGLF